ncbi:MAG: ABC transporter substrate-binding protein [Candidatus Thorarchaeota archaeon]
MKKRIFSAIFLMAFAVGFFPTLNVSAAPAAPAAPAATNSTDQSDVTIHLSTGVQTTTALSDMIAQFNNKTLTTDPNLQFKVQLDESTWETNSQYDTYTTKLSSKDTSLDVISMDVIWPPDFASSGFLTPLNDIFNSSYQSQFLLAPIEAGTYNDSIYGVPWFHDSAMLYYRTDVLKSAFDAGVIPADRAPQTWAELHDWSIDIMNDSTLVSDYNLTAGFVWQAKAYEGLICDFMEYIGGTGTYTFLNATKTGGIFDNSNIQDALKYMRSLIADEASPQGVLTFTEEESRAVWQAGSAVFMRNWPYAYKLSLGSGILNGSIAGTDQVFNVTTMPAENLNIANPRTSCLGGWQLGVSAYSTHKTEAKNFILWLTAAPQQLYYFLNGGQTPTLKALYNSPEILNSDQSYVSNFFPVFNSSLPRPVTPLYVQFSNAIQGPINSYLAGTTNLADTTKALNNAIENVVNPPPAGYEANVALFLIVLGLGTLVAIRKRKQKMD